MLYPNYQLLGEDEEDDVHVVPGNVDDAPRNANIAKAWAGFRPNVFTLLIWQCHWYYKEKLELDTQIYFYYSNTGWTQKLMIL
ncbi:hypothetical protein MA16_Dca008244 [Dendrobium catenatum]|uniref:Uncharacterized protein n=1 Tax=Dendrobium catenatum TaxID=906689 RepID=A0A2I0X6L6_9ASPA|nr:hypothetical protein MA16_Dca008244 [Dendrobium catenatum]